MKKLNHLPALILCLSVLLSCSVSNLTKIRSLKGYNTTKIGLRYDSLLLIPGSSHKIGFVVFTDSGKILKTSGFLGGTLRWNNFKVEAVNAKYYSGRLNIAKNNPEEDLSFIPLKIRLKYQPDKVFLDTLWLNSEKQIDIFPINNFKKSPGSTINFGMDVTYNNNKHLTYPNWSKLKKIMPNYEVLVKGGSYRNGAFTVSTNIFDNPDHQPGFMVRLSKNEDVSATFDMLLDYKDQYNIYGTGGSGLMGFSGSGGFSGSTGQNGQPGENGRNGGNGSYGDDIDVFTDMYFDSILNTNLVRVFVDNISTKKQQHLLINPDGGNLTIYATGGDGGSGGSGGNGGNGGKGITGEFYTEYVNDVIVKKDTAGREHEETISRSVQRQKPGGSGGFGGAGGYGGAGGNGGFGGHLIVYYTPAMKNNLYMIRNIVRGGVGGRGGSGAQGGTGGEGGDGQPKGRNGMHGHNGLEGPTGYEGMQGIVDLQEVDSIPW